MNIRLSKFDIVFFIWMVALVIWSLLTTEGRVTAKTSKLQSEFLMAQCIRGLTPMINFADGSSTYCLALTPESQPSYY